VTAGVAERSFTAGDAPGVVWPPADAGGGGARALVLVAHGGGGHANPGPHAAVPGFEAGDAVRFLARHLLG
jgi:hypothetical protein